MQSYGLKIKEIRLSLGLSQRAIAEKVGTTRDIIASYERGTARVTAELWEKILALLVPPASTRPVTLCPLALQIQKAGFDMASVCLNAPDPDPKEKEQ